ncbi:MAG: hypothetical protein OEW95_11870, partial [Candidatus Bathyarchaeota archaeon]|nr:hypothetical protein [Candidatus Bathyarchaeota archaeon]
LCRNLPWQYKENKRQTILHHALTMITLRKSPIHRIFNHTLAPTFNLLRYRQMYKRSIRRTGVSGDKAVRRLLPLLLGLSICPSTKRAK